jgi:hypothetical protein
MPKRQAGGLRSGLRIVSTFDNIDNWTPTRHAAAPQVRAVLPPSLQRDGESLYVDWDSAVNYSKTPQPKRNRVFVGFLGGVAVGIVFGLLSCGLYEGKGPHQASVWPAFWGLVGGLAGLVIGLVRRFR